MLKSVPSSISGNVTNFLWEVGKYVWAKWVVLAGFVLLWYIIVLWGYHSGRLPYQFDNFVQDTGIWRVFGSKSYQIDPSAKYALDPRLDMVEMVRHSVTGEGRVIHVDPIASQLTVYVSDEGKVVWNLDAEVFYYLKTGDEIGFCPKCSIDDIGENEYLTIVKNGIVNVETGEINTTSILITREVQ